jgi:membrane protein DedA with SNARE-associated domain
MFGDFIDWIEELGLLAVFVLAVLDSVGLPATGDAAVITWSAASDRPLVLIMLVAFAGGVVGDHIAYWVGRSGGSRLVRRFLHAEKERKLADRVHRHAPLVLVLGRMVAAIRTKAAVLAGSTQLGYVRFTFWNALGCALWATTYAILGRTVGKRVIDALDSVEKVVLVVVVVAVLAVGAYVGRRWYGQRRRARAAPPPPVADAE